MNRNYSLDLLRIFLCLCVIALHSLNYFAIENGIVATFVAVLLMQSNGVFYILSGYFNLEKEFKDAIDIKKFYKNKIIYILFPFLAFILVWTIWDYVHLNTSFNVLEVLNIYYEAVMDSSCDGHMWFMYPLFGLLLSTPFLSKMLHNMNGKELKYLWLVAVGWNFICFYLCYDIGIEFRFLGWLLDGWLLYYFVGYYYRHVIANENKIKWIIIGIVGFVVTNIGLLYFEHFENATDYQIMFTFFCIGCLLFWDKFVHIKNEKVQKIICYLSKNTFMIYLFHMRAMEYVVRKLSITGEGLGTGLLVVFATFGAALIASIVANALMKPIQKFIDKKWVIK